MKTLKKWHDQQMTDPAYREEYDSLQTHYNLIRQSIAARNAKKMSQSELAKKIGTDQAHISRFESGNYNPSLKFMNRLAKGLDKKLDINFS